MLDKHSEELTFLYEELKDWFMDLDESHVEDAYGIMKESSSLQASFEKLSADIGKMLADSEKQAKATHALISRQSSTKVNEGDRIATSSDEVLKAWELVSDLQKTQRYIDSTAKHISRIYFDSKLVYENASRALRNPVGSDKLVGKV